MISALRAIEPAAALRLEGEFSRITLAILVELVTGNSISSGVDQLDRLNNEALLSASKVDAAVAYVHDTGLLFEGCWKKGIPLTLWARYDNTVPVSIPVLEWFLSKSQKSANYSCKLLASLFHPKIIWWHGFGAYIGSANLTHSAWYRNFEAGIFLSEDELDEQGMREELVRYFEEIDDVATPLTREILDEMNRLMKDRYQTEEVEAKKRFALTRLIPELKPNILINKTPLIQRRRARFLEEWRETLEILRSISERVSAPEFRPAWVPAESPKGAQADQFLNAFYYSYVGGTTEGVRESHEKNKGDRERALVEAMTWWKRLPDGPTGERETLVRWAPFLAEQLKQEKLLSLGKDEFAEVCQHVHAMLEYARQVRYESMGMKRPPNPVPKLERCRQFAHWLYEQRAQNGDSTIKTIDYVLYGGSIGSVPERIFEVCNTPARRLRNIGISSFGEMAGWALPNDMPPRNGRTNKALRALGYPVKLWGDQ